MNKEVSTKPIVAISSCIYGNNVRYDGELKYFPDICEHLKQHFELLPVCPEVEIGLTVPRPPVQLTGNPEHPKMTGRDHTNIDITKPMREYCNNKSQQLKNISGYVFKSRSPSCGLKNIPIFDNDTIIEENGQGLFAKAMNTLYPSLPLAEETDLETKQQRQQFIEQVLNYYKKQTVL